MNGRGLSGIVRALGGDLYAGGGRACVPGPGHSSADRSVSLVLTGGRVIAHSFAGDDWRLVLDELRRLGLIDGAGRLPGAGAVDAGDFAPPPEGARVRTALRLWSEGRPVESSAAAHHLRARGLSGPWSPELRTHAGVPAAIYLDRGTRRPALLAAIRDAAGGLCGVEVTYLSSQGDRARVATPRKTVGLRPAGSAVRLSGAAAELLVAEGTVSALSAMRLLSLPGWALMAAGNLAQWTPPEGVAEVVIAADRDAAGARAAWRLLRRLRQMGFRCRLVWPPAPHRDWNEALLASRTAEGPEVERGTRGAGAADGWSGSPAPESRAMTGRQTLIPEKLRAQLRVNARAGDAGDPLPVLKLFNPAGSGTWLITELDLEDEDRLFGLCDLDMGFPELGYVSLGEITAVRLPGGLSIERDVGFSGRLPLSVWADLARDLGSIRAAEAYVGALPRTAFPPPTGG